MKTPTAKRWLIILLILALLSTVGILSLGIYIGNQLVSPVPRTIGPPPDRINARTVTFPSPSGSDIVGWLAEAEQPAGAVVLLHAIRGDRRNMTNRAAFLNNLGYHTLSIDFQAHGESPGERITLGHLESMDAAAAVAYLQKLDPTLPVAVIGTSLGGAAALLADYGSSPPAAIVAEAVFANVETGVRNRLEMRLGRPGRMLSPLLTWRVRPLLGISPAELDTVRAATRVTTPTLVISGEADRHAKPAEAAAIHAALAGPKEIWTIPGAAHVDLHQFARADYEKRVAAFLARHFQNRANPIGETDNPD